MNTHAHWKILNLKKNVSTSARCFLWSAADSLEQGSLHLVQKIFLQALEPTGKMVIILDDFNEISPYYTPKVNILIRAIRDKTASQIWVSSRFSH
jgi:hypothetical protein